METSARKNRNKCGKKIKKEIVEGKAEGKWKENRRKRRTVGRWRIRK
jgi:hypothetical protein